MTSVQACSHDFNAPFEDFLAAAASGSHVPGGGSIAAAAGALGAAMGSMVANLTLGKKGYEERRPEAEAMAGAFREGMEDFRRLAAADMEAFDAVMRARRIRGTGPSETEARSLAVRSAMRQAVTAPLEIARKAADLLDLNRRLAAFGNAGAVNDCGVGAVLLEAVVRAAMLSVDVNLPSLDDGELLAEVKARKAEILARTGGVMEETMSLVETRRR
ncbi:MAG: cyclodeaminase/cyclohydrolase family protein [Deltaproteobacteria bacterium]|jgi:formiminotetrahydrofolate cyclodeaminase|nr:cyclodeaminase/cyclohydrolase family protein [Deltaproteobacteria bacterium]